MFRWLTKIIYSETQTSTPYWSEIGRMLKAGWKLDVYVNFSCHGIEVYHARFYKRVWKLLPWKKWEV